jgi:spore maturation protein CgeB
MTRIFVIHPGPSFSTADVFTGLCAGLRANACEVIAGELDKAMEFQSQLYAAGQAAGLVKEGATNISYFASPYVAQHAIASEPDAVIVVSAHNFNIVSAKTLRQAGLKTAVIMTESPYFAEFERTMAAVYDTVFTNEARCADSDYFGGHPSVHYLPHAYNPEVHQPGEADPSLASDVFFCGSLFHERALLFADVDWTGIGFRHRGYAPGRAEQDIVKNEQTAAHYRSAKINLNHHRTTMDYALGGHIQPGSAVSLGPRAYEIAACGGFQLCDDSRAELFTLFGDSVPTYKAGDPHDLSRQIRRWLERPDGRAARAAESVALVQPHSWTVRAKQILEAIL